MDIHNIIKKDFDSNENFFILPKKIKLAFNEISYYYQKKNEDLKKLVEINKNDIINDKKLYLKEKLYTLNGYSLKYYGVADLYLNLLSTLNLNYISFEYENINEDNLFNIFVHFTIKNINYYEYECHYIVYLFKKYMMENNYDELIKFMTLEKNYDKSLNKFVKFGRDLNRTILKDNSTNIFYKVIRIDNNFIKCYPLIPKYINSYTVYSTKNYNANNIEYFEHNSNCEIICLLNDLYFHKI
jgi:hypothetical protein